MFKFILQPLRKRFSKDRVYYFMLDSLFGIYPNNIELYKLALIHRSASLFLDDGTPMNNERLEYLGDSILQAVVTDYLFIEFPDRDEGFLTQMRSKIVSRTSLNQLCMDIGLDGYIIANGGTGMNKHIYGDTVEAMIGAIYLDKGYDFVNRMLINKILRNNIDLMLMTVTESDFKSRLIEWCQKNKRQIVFSTSASTTSPKQSPVFMSKVIIDGLEVAYGEGASKKEAQQNAAYNVSKVMSDTQSDHLLEIVDQSEHSSDKSGERDEHADKSRSTEPQPQHTQHD